MSVFDQPVPQYRASNWHTTSANLKAAARPMPLEIAKVTVRLKGGLICLNDLHKAAGGKKKHLPQYFLDRQQVQDLVFELENEKLSKTNTGIPVLLKDCATEAETLSKTNTGIPVLPRTDTQNRVTLKDCPGVMQVIHGGNDRGTYVCVEIALAYAAWVSPRLHLEILRKYLRTSHLPSPSLPPTPTAQDLINLAAAADAHANYYLDLKEDAIRAAQGQLSAESHVRSLQAKL